MTCSPSSCPDNGDQLEGLTPMSTLMMTILHPHTYEVKIFLRDKEANKPKR